MDTGVLTLTTFVAAALSVLGATSLAFDLFLRDRTRMKHRLNEEFHDTLRLRVRRSALFKTGDDGTSIDADVRLDLRSLLELMIEQSGLRLPMERFMGIAAAAGLGAFVAALLVMPHWAMAVPVGAIAFLAPFAYVWGCRNKRLNKLRSQLPEAFELMSRAVRAGQTMNAALQLVAYEGKPPISEEFAYCCEQQNLGLPQEVTLRDLARRNGIMELNMFVVAVLVQRQTGGNPVELLNNLSDVIRKRVRMAGKVRALTSEGRMQAVVLSILPIVALAAIYILNRSYAQVLLDHPKLLIGMLVSQALGTLWIRKIVNFDY